MILFEQVGSDPVVKNAVFLFDVFFDEDNPYDEYFDYYALQDDLSDYYKLQKAMLRLVGAEEIAASYWQNYICKLIAPSDNAFSRMAERGVFAADGYDGAAAAVFALAMEELQVIRDIYAYDFQALAQAITKRTGVPEGAENLAKLTAAPEKVSRRQGIHEALTAEDARTSATLLARYFHDFGAGDFEGYDAFAWEGTFHGVAFGDPITMDDLIGYESQKRALIENTEFLLRGLPANNVLLYGDSGTGKSSSVKALLNMYKARGLKLIAVPKERIDDLPRILEYVGGRGLKFIIFIDDLSFEENEVGYKSFKSVIEGSVSARTTNTVICVTSNRRNIIKEVWKDRAEQDDIHLRDNLQEKRSLADRFGLTIVYISPEKREYLEIVAALAKNAGLNMDAEYLSEQALIWEIRHGGRSGRTARQFIDHMVGLKELGQDLNK
jgi:predicted AAA+ superfamily ATPase